MTDADEIPDLFDDNPRMQFFILVMAGAECMLRGGKLTVDQLHQLAAEGIAAAVQNEEKRNTKHTKRLQ